MKIETLEIILDAADECLSHFRIISDSEDGQIKARDEVKRLLGIIEDQKAKGKKTVGFKFER